MSTRALADLVPPEALSTRTGATGELPVVAPRTEGEWGAVLELARARAWHVHPIGGGTRGLPVPEEADLLLSTARMRALLAFEPGDGTLTAQAGATMASLAEHTRAGGYHLVPDVPHPARATLGGAIAFGCGGFDRLRYGPTRGVLLGLEVVLADGTHARSGGRLVKNVTGYDLHRLICGSRGTLAVILSASLRLVPLPRERLLLAHEPGDRATALAAAHALGREPIRPEALVVVDGGLYVFLGGRAEVVRAERERALAVLGGAREVHGDELAETWASLRDRPPVPDRIELATRPSRLPESLAAVDALAEATGRSTSLHAHPCVGLATVGLGPGDARTLLAAWDRHVAPSLRGTGATARLCIGGLLRASVSAHGDATHVHLLEDRLRAALDPNGLLVGSLPGRG